MGTFGPLLLRGISGPASAFQALVGATASTSAARGMQRSGWPWNCSPAAKADSLVGEGALGGTGLNTSAQGSVYVP